MPVSRMVTIMTALAILISLPGSVRIGLLFHEADKEIGIRKMLGASVKDVVFLLSEHFIGLVLIANLIAWPLAWLALHQWIQGMRIGLPSAGGCSWWPA